MFSLSKFFWIFIIILQIIQSSTDTDDKSQVAPSQNSKFNIFGGYRPQEHTLAKYIVSIRLGNIKKIAGDNHVCSGSLIFSKVVLTAAHCATDTKYNNYENLLVVAGTPYLHKKIDSERIYKVVKILVHPSFSYANMISDIALLFLEKPVEENDLTISLIPLIDKKPRTGLECIGYGWGRIFPKGPRTVELIYMNLTLNSRLQCRERYEMNPAVICAGDIEKNLWKGLSGGPLLCEGMLTGVISFGFQRDDTPNYFANVYEHRKWILQNEANHFNLYRILLLFSLLKFYI